MLTVSSLEIKLRSAINRKKWSIHDEDNATAAILSSVTTVRNLGPVVVVQYDA